MWIIGIIFGVLLAGICTLTYLDPIGLKAINSAVAGQYVAQDWRDAALVGVIVVEALGLTLLIELLIVMIQTRIDPHGIWWRRSGYAAFRRHVLWMAPLIIVALNAFAGLLFPVLLERVSLINRATTTDIIALLVMALLNLALLTIWRGVQNKRVTERMAPMRFLQQNSWVSILLAIAMTIIFVVLADRQIVWITVLPWIYSVVNAIMSADRGINTALGKSPQEMSEEEDREQKLARGETI